MQHAELIYKHTSTRRCIASHEALYILTGCTKSDSWALAVFDRTDAPPYNDDLMRLEDVTYGGGSRPEYIWDETWSSSEARSGSSERPGLKDQTLFVRGFTLDFSGTIRERMDFVVFPPSHGSPDTGSSNSSAPPSPPGGRKGPGGGGGSLQGGHQGRHGSSSPRFGGASGSSSARETRGQGDNAEQDSVGGSPSAGRWNFQEMSIGIVPDSQTEVSLYS